MAHHPFNPGDHYRFLETLQNRRYNLFLHGHTHRDVSTRLYDAQSEPAALVTVGAGSFAAPGNHRPEGVPLRYNLLEVQFGPNKQKEEVAKKLVVHTRQREVTGMPWQEAPIYPQRVAGEHCLSRSGTREEVLWLEERELEDTSFNQGD